MAWTVEKRRGMAYDTVAEFGTKKEALRAAAQMRREDPGPGKVRGWPFQSVGSTVGPYRVVKRKNPVRIGATVTGSGTGWIKARAVKVRRSGKGYVIDVKR